MRPPQIETSGLDRSAAIQSTMTMGFSSDPITRWLWPDSHIYLTNFPRFSGAFGGNSLELGTAFETDCHGAAALWLPPGETSDAELMEEILGATIEEDRMEEIGEFFGKMDEFHPHEDHYYLALIAADPAMTGRGLGAALMKRALSMVDEAGLPSYLESSNPRNISLYERHGFEIMGEIQVGSSPVMTPMYRTARS